MESRLEKALIASEHLLEGMEAESISTSSALMQCLRLARLMSDSEGMQWLQYEFSGYPCTKEGFIETNAFNIALEMSRGYFFEKKECIFTEIASELEQEIETLKLNVGTITTSGASVSGDYAFTGNKQLSKCSYKTNL